MKTWSPSETRHCMSGLTECMAVVLVLSMCSFPAAAALGGNVESVQEDQAHLKGSLHVTQAQMYAVHEIKTETGTIVREYVSPTGQVFGVAWQGPFIPEMQQLLGTYFQQYSEAARAQKAHSVGRRPLNIQQPGLVVQGGGHMRSYFGRAYVPEMLPQGVKAEEIR